MLPDLVLAAIRTHRPTGAPPILLACSGGLDSQVLLHSAAAAWPAASLFVAHVHHGLQPEADEWLAFCQASAERLGLAFLSRRVPALPDRIEGGLESWARRMRYQQLAEMAAQAGADIVLTAHHANDQLETYHLRRLRGAGPLGLGAMRASAAMPGAPQRLLLRPFLGVERERIAQYAAEHRLDWVDDPSNQDLRYSRNRMRRELARTMLLDPSSLQRGLAVIDGFQNAADAATRQATEDLAACRMMLSTQEGRLTNASTAIPPWAASLSRAALSRLPRERAIQVMRLWLANGGCRMPSRGKMAELLRQLVAGASAQARLQHDGVWLLRYRDRIDATQDLPAGVDVTSFCWAGERFLVIAGQRLLFDRLSPEKARTGAGVDARWLAAAELVMDRAQGHDRLRLVPGGPSRTWKNLSQERGIPPWLRAALPVLRRGDRVVYAAPFGMNLDAARGAGPTAGRPPESTLRSGAGEPSPRIAIDWLAPAPLSRWL